MIAMSPAPKIADLFASPFWAPCAAKAPAAERVCARAARPDPIDWSASTNRERELSLMAQIEALPTHISASVCSSGWTPLLARLFFDMGESLSASDRAPLALWKWSDVKSKFGSLRAYGRLASLGESALEISLLGLGSDGPRPSWSTRIEGEELDILRRRLADLGAQASLHCQDEHWSRRMKVTFASSQSEAWEEHLAALAPIGEECSLLASSAEAILSPMICESCSAPSLRHNFPAPVCPHCSSAKRSDPELASLSPIRLPRRALALASLCYLSLVAGNELQRLARREGAAAASPGPEQIARDLAPWAKAALAGADLNEDLGRGVRLAHYPWPDEALLWLDEAGCDWSLRDDFGAAPADWIQAHRPAAWAVIERRALQTQAAASPSALGPPRSL